MPFVKGQAKGRPKGIKNSEATHSLRKLLEDAFIRNHTVALQKIDQMFQGKDMADFKFMLTLKANLEPKPAVVIDNSTHTHHTTNIKFAEMSKEQLTDYLFKRNNGLSAAKPN